MFLTRDQLVDLTHYRQRARQEAALRAMGVPHLRRPDGSLAVASALFDGSRQPATISPPPPRVRDRHGKAKKA